jgi:lipoprotein-releasing system permease protein
MIPNREPAPAEAFFRPGRFRQLRWIGFVAGRYVSRGRKNSPAPVFSILGIATGVLALTVIISVMNGFQLGFIENILEISSFHVRVEGLPEMPWPDSLSARLSSLPGIASTLRFREAHGLARGKTGNPRGIVARGLGPDAPEQDPGLASRLVFESGSFDLAARNSILLGAELARHLSLQVGDQLTFIALGGRDSFLGGLSLEEGEEPFYTVKGIFRCGFYEYDLGWAFINIDRAAELAGPGDPPALGIKLKNRWQDQKALAMLEEFLGTESFPGEKPRLSSWRDYNRSFFGALRTEKLLMFILVGLIFIVVGLNIFQAQRRAVLERREEIGLLRALGAAETAVRLVFVWDGFVIGLGGAILGLFLGLIISFRISDFFSLLETLVNAPLALFHRLSTFLGGGGGAGEFAVFSPRIFYIKEIPSRIIPGEVFLIFMFGFLSALLAAWFASGKISRTKPAEVLRYE